MRVKIAQPVMLFTSTQAGILIIDFKRNPPNFAFHSEKCKKSDNTYGYCMPFKII